MKISIIKKYCIILLLIMTLAVTTMSGQKPVYINEVSAVSKKKPKSSKESSSKKEKVKTVTIKSSEVKKILEGIVADKSWNKPSYAGMCLKFVADFWASLGATRSSAPTAMIYARKHVESHSIKDIPVGADVYFNYAKWHGTPAGHIGIYLGNNKFVSAFGPKIVIYSFSGVRKTYRGHNYTWKELFYGWGYHDNINLIEDLGKFQISAIDDVTYNGEAQKPSFTVTADEQTLTENTDYKVSYENNIDAGTASVKVEGIGAYETYGTQKTIFKIKKAALDEDKLTLINDHCEYTGKEVKPRAVYSDETATFDVTYENNVEVGTAVAHIKAKGNYKGSCDRSFTIAVYGKSLFKQLMNGALEGLLVKPAALKAPGTEKPADKKTSAAKKSTTEKKSSKKTAPKKTVKKSTSSKKTTTKKSASSKKTTSSKKSSKKSASSKKSSKKSTTKKKSSKKNSKKRR